MSNRLAASIAFASALLSVGGACSAADVRIAAADHPKDAMELGGKPEAQSAALSKLSEAADLGVMDAQLRLAAMYGAGRGVETNPARAFGLYRQIIKVHADVHPRHKRAPGVARAFVALGNYYRSGIPGVIGADKRRAATMLHYAASYLGDADAQCDLAQMYLDGEGIERNERLAVGWLANAAKKRHGKSQALLGDLLWRGSDFIPRQASKGLALMSLARQNASNKAEARWIEAMYRGAHEGSEAAIREGAVGFADSWQGRMGRSGPALYVKSVPTKTSAADAPTDVPSKVLEGMMQVGLTGPGDQR